MYRSISACKTELDNSFRRCVAKRNERNRSLQLIRVERESGGSRMRLRIMNLEAAARLLIITFR